MGIQPHFYFLCGINDTKSDDPRFDQSVRDALGDDWWYVDVPQLQDVGMPDNFDLMRSCYPQDERHTTKIELGAVYHECVEGRAHPCAGFVISEPDEEFAYALHLAGITRMFSEEPMNYEEACNDLEAYGVPGYIVFPSLNPEKHRLRYRNHMRGDSVEAVDLAIAEKRWINYYGPWQTDIWFQKAIHVLHLAGWTGVTRKMLKIMLVKEWQ